MPTAFPYPPGVETYPVLVAEPRPFVFPFQQHLEELWPSFSARSFSLLPLLPTFVAPLAFLLRGWVTEVCRRIEPPKRTGWAQCAITGCSAVLAAVHWGGAPVCAPPLFPTS